MMQKHLTLYLINIILKYKIPSCDLLHKNDNSEHIQIISTLSLMFKRTSLKYNFLTN